LRHGTLRRLVSQADPGLGARRRDGEPRSRLPVERRRAAAQHRPGARGRDESVDRRARLRRHDPEDPRELRHPLRRPPARAPTTPSVRTLAVVVLAVALACQATATSQPRARPILLMVTYSGAYQHDVVRREPPGRPSVAERPVVEPGQRSGPFDGSRPRPSDELASLSVEPLTGTRAVLLFTRGSLPPR